jgi:hypothetical protein
VLGGERRDAVAEGIVFASGMDEIPMWQTQLLQTLAKNRGIGRGWGRMQLDFERDLLGAQVDEEVDFMSLCRAPKVGLTPGFGLLEDRNELIDNKSFPTHAPGGMNIERQFGTNTEKVVQQTSISKYNFGLFTRRLPMLAK